MDRRTEQPSAPAFEGWAIVEVMGHRRHFGMVREVEAFGGKMCRVDVPESPALQRERLEYQDDPAPERRGYVVRVTVKETVPAAPAQTFLYGAHAIFGITPCTEEVVRKALEREQHDRSLPVARAALPAVAEPEADHDGNDQGGGAVVDAEGY